MAGMADFVLDETMLLTDLLFVYSKVIETCGTSVEDVLNLYEEYY